MFRRKLEWYNGIGEPFEVNNSFRIIAKPKKSTSLTFLVSSVLLAVVAVIALEKHGIFLGLVLLLSSAIMGCSAYMVGQSSLLISGSRLQMKHWRTTQVVNLAALESAVVKLQPAARHNDTRLLLIDKTGGKLDLSLTTYRKSSYEEFMPIVRDYVIRSGIQIDQRTQQELSAYSNASQK
jgi:hypothetical protein